MPEPVKIQIDTAADTSGVDRATDALEEVIDKADEVVDALKPPPAPSVIEEIPADSPPAVDALGEVVDAADEVVDALKPSGAPSVIEEIPRDARPAEGSIRALEEEVARLQRELAGLKVGSNEFVAMAAKAKTAQTALAAAEVEAKRLGGTLGRRGNAGAAILEASRGLEDLQYGVRGVLNNIPGLVLALGGTGGLAGVLSIVAVGGSVLYGLLSKGTKESKEETEDYIQTLRELAREFGNPGLDVENARADGFDVLLGKQRQYAAEQQRIADGESKLAKEKLKGDGDVAVAEARLELARLEAALQVSTGEAALKLAKDREAAVTRIVELERSIRDAQRAEEERAAAYKVTAAEGALGERDRQKTFLTGKSQDASAAVEVLADKLARLTTNRIQNAAVLGSLKEGFEKQKGDSINPVEIGLLKLTIGKIDEGIAKLAEPSKREAEVKVDLEGARETRKAADDNFAKAAEEQRAAAEALRTAALNLTNVQQSQGQARKTEAGLQSISDAGATDEKIRSEGEKAARSIGDDIAAALKNIGDAATTPQVTGIVERIKSLAADGVQGGEQNEIVGLFQQLLSRSQEDGTANRETLTKFLGNVDLSISTMRDLKAKSDDQQRQINQIKSQLGNRNP